MSHLSIDEEYLPFRVGGIIPEQFNYSFTIAHEVLSANTNNVDEFLLYLWDEAATHETDTSRVWSHFMMLIKKKASEFGQI